MLGARREALLLNWAPDMILITGGAGFIGGNFVHHWLSRMPSDPSRPLVVLDKLTYAGNPHTIAQPLHSGQAILVQGDIANAALVTQLLATHRPQAVLHFAAESHVDRSIHGPAEFVQTNVVGTFTLLEAVRAHWQGLRAAGDTQAEHFRFLHVSTDEVFGSLGPHDAAFTESHAYAPNSPYAASKAGSDHLVRAYHHTWGLPTLITNCSNNYGPYHFPEKLIPLMILNALEGRELPLYGDGLQVRDWLYVRDHCEALCQVLERGQVGQTYNIGGGNELRNADVVHAICDRLDAWQPRAQGSYRALVRHVQDRPGHDRRYAIDASKIAREIGWRPQQSFQSGLDETVRWYLDNADWVHTVRSGAYRQWLAQHYGDQA